MGNENENIPTCGYRLNSIYFYLTEGCNLNCRHCWLAPAYLGEGARQAASLDLELFQDIVRQGLPLGLGMVKLTGGEPLIHPHIAEILDFLSGTDVALTMETNGVACTPALAGKIKKCPKAFVSVSVDGADAATHEWVRGVKGCFAKTLAGIRHLVDAGLRPQLIMALMKRNLGQIEAFIELAEKLGAASVKFNPVMPASRGENLHARGETCSIQELLAAGRRLETELAAKTRIKIFFTQPFAFRPLSRIYGEKGDQGKCGILGIIGVLSSGHYALCGVGAMVPELVFGDAARDRLAEVWDRNPVLNEIRAGLPGRLKGICAQCLMKELCLGACIAMNYYRAHDLFAPQWYCDEAQKAGLFPKNRLISS
jgi:SynChlorMet cassette radical SAM/SPASM protein ScmF